MEEEEPQPQLPQGASPPPSPNAPSASNGSPAAKKRKRGILGVPVGETPMLFSFTSRELWPDEKSDADDDDDDDYRPVQRSPAKARLPKVASVTGRKPRKKAPAADQSTIAESISSTEVNGSLVVEAASIISQASSTIPADDASSISSLSSSDSSFSSDFDGTPSKGKGAKRGATRKSRATKPRGRKPAAAAAGTTKAKAPRAKAKAKTPRGKSGKASNSRKKAKASASPKARKSTASSTNGKGADGSGPSTSRAARGSSSLSSSSVVDFNLLLKSNKLDFEQILPPEILVQVFEYVLDAEQHFAKTLVRLSQVCDNWRNLIICTPILWQRLDLTGFADDRFPLANFQRLNDENELFTCVKELNLSGWSSVNAEKIIDIVTTSSNFEIELLNVRNCRNISSKFLETVVRRCPKLEKLDISAITTSSHQNCQNPFTTPIFKPLLEACGEKMVSLKMSENMVPSFPTSISIIMEFCHNLQVLDVSNVASLGARSTSISVDKLQNSCPKLRILRAANVNFTPTTCSASQPTVPGFPFLEELSIAFHESFMMPASDANTDWTLELLTKGADKLTLLDIRGARYISPRGLLKVPTWQMKHLSISNCAKLEDDTLEMVFTKWCKTLVDVDMSWNKLDRCVNACIGALCEIEDDVASPLRTIQLRGSAVSYEALAQLMHRCPNLASIDLQSCRSLPRGIKRAYADEEFTTLRTEILEGKYD